MRHIRIRLQPEAALTWAVDFCAAGEERRLQTAKQRTGLGADHGAFALRRRPQQHLMRTRIARARRLDVEDVKGIEVQLAFQLARGEGAVIGDQRHGSLTAEPAPRAQQMRGQRLFAIEDAIFMQRVQSLCGGFERQCFVGIDIEASRRESRHQVAQIVAFGGQIASDLDLEDAYALLVGAGYIRAHSVAVARADDAAQAHRLARAAQIIPQRLVAALRQRLMQRHIQRAPGGVVGFDMRQLRAQPGDRLKVAEGSTPQARRKLFADDMLHGSARFAIDAGSRRGFGDANRAIRQVNAHEHMPQRRQLVPLPPGQRALQRHMQRLAAYAFYHGHGSASKSRTASATAPGVMRSTSSR